MDHSIRKDIKHMAQTTYYAGFLSKMEELIETALDAAALREMNDEIAGDAEAALLEWLMRNEADRVKDRYPEIYRKWREGA